jgi:hypothetical protein
MAAHRSDHAPVIDRSHGRRLVHPSITAAPAAPQPSAVKRRNPERPHCGPTCSGSPSLQMLGRSHWCHAQIPARSRASSSRVPSRNTQRETSPQHWCAPTLAQHPYSHRRTFGSGSQPQPGQLSHQPPAADLKLGPHPLDRPALFDIPHLEVAGQIRKAEFRQPRRPPRPPRHRLHPTPITGRCPLAVGSHGAPAAGAPSGDGRPAPRPTSASSHARSTTRSTR